MYFMTLYYHEIKNTTLGNSLGEPEGFQEYVFSSRLQNVDELISLQMYSVVSYLACLYSPPRGPRLPAKKSLTSHPGLTFSPFSPVGPGAPSFP